MLNRAFKAMWAPVELLNEFLAQIGLIRTVWAPFLIVMFIVGGVIWRLLKHHYKGRLETKDDLISLRDAQLQDYKDKLSGATPDQAKARIEELERRGLPNTALEALQLSFEDRSPFVVVETFPNGLNTQISVLVRNVGNGALSMCSLRLLRLNPDPRGFYPLDLHQEPFSLVYGQTMHVVIANYRSGQDRIRLSIPFRGTVDHDPFIPVGSYTAELEVTAPDSRPARLTVRLWVDGERLRCQTVS